MNKPVQLTRKPWYFYFMNPVSIIGIMTAIMAGVFHLSLFVLDFSRGLYNPYLNIWFHIVIPPVVVVGFFLALFGVWRTRRRIKKKVPGAEKSLGPEAQRILLVGGFLCLLLFIPFLGFTSYAGYKFTDSVEFCGQACHEPMKAVFTAYQVSSHARVPCSSCHIGEGASWFVRSKLSGTRQVFATVFDTFHRPIQTPIKDLRPARETCERCHWPEKNFGSRVVDLPHYASDEENTFRPLSMVLKTGGGNPDLAPVRGIHWHLLPTHRTEYVAVDEKRMEIPWVKVVTDEGEQIFRSDDLPPNAPRPGGEMRVMDCLDCHNRPSHKYRTPDELLNTLFSYELLDPSFPFLKREAARLMAQSYEDTPSALAAITAGLKAFYEKSYPEIAAARKEELDQSIKAVLHSFETNLFPEMRTDWRTDPDHIGHKYYPGCHRCHDDRHKAADGSVISFDCGLCHEFMEHKETEKGRVLVPGGYHHPYKLEKAHEEVACYDCHTGGPTPPPTCNGCHSDVTAFMAGTAGIPFGITGEAHAHYGEVDCGDCHDGPQRITDEEIVPLCMDCHDEDGFEASLKTELEQLAETDARAKAAIQSAKEGAAVEWAKASSDTLDRVNKVRPIHNIGFALKILRKVEKGPETETK